MIRTGIAVFGTGLLLAALALPLAAGADHNRSSPWAHAHHYHDTPRHAWRAPAPTHKDRKRVDAAYWKWHREHVRVYGYAPHPCRNSAAPRYRHGR